MTKHEQVFLNTARGERIRCDKGIRPLIRLLNTVGGVHTIFSCQGNSGTHVSEVIKDGYVLMAGQGVPTFLGVLVYHWLQVAPQAHKLPGLMICTDSERWVSADGELVRVAGKNRRYRLGWVSDEYPRLLKAIRETIKSIPKETIYA